LFWREVDTKQASWSPLP